MRGHYVHLPSLVQWVGIVGFASILLGGHEIKAFVRKSLRFGNLLKPMICLFGNVLEQLLLVLDTNTPPKSTTSNSTYTHMQTPRTPGSTSFSDDLATSTSATLVAPNESVDKTENMTLI